MVDLGGISVELPDMPALSLADLLGSLDLNVSADGMGQLAGSLLEGYRQYAAEHPEADYSGIRSDFCDYLKTAEAREILKQKIGEIIKDGDGVTVTAEQLRNMLSEIMTGYQQYAADNGLKDPEKFGDYLLEYLRTPEAQQIMDQWAQEIFSGIAGSVDLTGEQLEDLASELAAGYQQYAAANGLPDPGKMGEYFIDYLGSEDGRKRLTDGLSGMIDMDSLESQVTSAMGTYMQSAMSAYGDAIGSALETQITSAVTQVMGQLASGMESALGQAMTRVGNSLEQALSGAMNIDGDAFADAFQMNMTGEEFTELMLSMGSAESASYDSNLQSLGYVDFDVPAGH